MKGHGRHVSLQTTWPWQSTRASRPVVGWSLHRKLNDTFTKKCYVIPHAVLKTALPGDCTLLSPLGSSSSQEGKRGLKSQPQQIKGIVHFVGGAFAGAAPVSLYSELLEYIVEDGFSVIVTPYQVTFRHDSCARNLDSLFSDTLDRLQTEPSSSAGSSDTAMMVPSNVPIFGIGHSNGALMHALIGSSDFSGRSRKPTAANILISFNNRQVAEAVPVPLTPLRDTVNSMRKGDETLEEQTRKAAMDAIDSLSWLPSGGKNDQGGTLDSMYEILPATVQIGSVLDEVGDGLTDFVPSPEENRRLIASEYSVNKTLILQFQDDSIDESSVLFRTLKRKPKRSVTYTTLDYGSHTTPLNVSAPSEIRRLATTVVAFLNRCSTLE